MFVLPGMRLFCFLVYDALSCEVAEPTAVVSNYEEDTLFNSFDNHDYLYKGISKLCLINELDKSLLLVASKDGNIRIWKDYMSKGHQKLVTAFSSVQGNRPGARGVNTVVDWQKQSGYLFISGEMSSIMAWDMDKEQLVNTIPSILDCSVSALDALWMLHMKGDGCG
ncbi:unnamed protein product [Fraxinus pennsylvanica]|uniref:Uncharacterized protein n=1 Tax=Fraxinus pennsylvanica TaxID=56036 RepID=A0AAD2A0V5_9LAMI|nr:unnamed protein product [Fraxinus pennsylvanica]